MSQSALNATPLRAPITVLGVPMDNLTQAEVLDTIGEIIALQRPQYAAVVDVGFLMQSVEDVELRRILCDANLVLAGDRGLLWASSFLGNRLPECFPPAQLIPQIFTRAEQKGWKVFLLGDAPTGLDAVAEKIRAAHPTLSLVGTMGLASQPLLEMDHAEIRRRIRAARPDLLLVAFGCPKSEKWISMNFRETSVPLSLGVGTSVATWFAAAAEKGDAVETGGKPRWMFTWGVLQQSWQLRRGKASKKADESMVTPDPYGNFIINAPARLDAVAAQSHGIEWQRATENGNILFDLSGTDFADSTGIGLLVRLRRRTVESGHQFFLVGPSPAISASLKLLKLDEFFAIQATMAEARSFMEDAAQAAPVTSGVQAAELQIRWAGEVTALNIVELGAFTESELTQATPGMAVMIDLSRVTFMDSAGIGLMLRFKKNLKRRDIALGFFGVTDSVRNVLRHTRLEDYLLTNPK